MDRPHLFLLDYDGTLTDFERDPERSLLSPRAKKVLQGLRKRYPVIFISGRYLKSLRKVSGLPHFPMVGTHGFESRNLPKHLRLASPAQERFYAKEAQGLWKAVQPLLRRFPGIHIEHKPYSSTLHYRGVALSPAQVRSLERGFRAIFRRSVTLERWDLMAGKMMLEAKPRGFNKGKAVKKIVRHFPDHRVVYAGDDITDLSVFKSLGKKGLKVAVGTRIPKRYSDLRFPSPKALLEWLAGFTRG
ncbi:MAG TPA: trehalose-phosphatase [bacterium]|nr:trehalose-phosphatase [bacterium]